MPTFEPEPEPEPEPGREPQLQPPRSELTKNPLSAGDQREVLVPVTDRMFWISFELMLLYVLTRHLERKAATP